MKAWPKIRYGGRWFLDWIYPRHCFSCKQLLATHSAFRYICEPCWAHLPWIQGVTCTHCGIPFDGEGVVAKMCPACIELKPYFQRGKALLSLTQGARDWVHGLKYRPGLHLFRDIQHIMPVISDLKAYLEDTVLVPVPLYPSRQRARGYNQSEEIALSLSRVTQTKVMPLLTRIKDTPSQTQFSREERLDNVKKAFQLKKGFKLDLSKTYTLIDDVYTTGATLNACAKVLYQQGGVSGIQVLVLARGQ